MPIICFIVLILSVPWASARGAEFSFVPAATCGLCHSRIQAPETVAADLIGQYPLWSGSMMSHASRDPYWKAKVRYETATTPAAVAIIEDKCLRCHAPSQQYEYRGRNARMPLKDLTPGGEGVTCTACHQIVAEGLGTRESFTGGFRIGAGQQIFGPHPEPFSMPMQHHTGYTPTLGKQILDPALCGSCHTVITPTLAADGRVTGEFIEQATYLEWLASEYPATGMTCQGCHVPALETDKGDRAAQYIAHRPPGGPFPPTRPRVPFGLHFFAGANAGMLEALAGEIPDESAVLRRGAGRARASLQSALDLRVGSAVSGDALNVSVEVLNLTGHKLPTAFPSRRVWLDVQVLARDGSVLFESGAWDRRSGELIASADQPHQAVISRAGEAMIYEASYLDSAGKKTMSLLRAAAYGKDNRILPRGFDASRGLPGGWTARKIAPAGVGLDAGFQPGSHRVRYQYGWRSGQPPWKIRVEAWYQSISPAHAAALNSVDHADIRAFQDVYAKSRMPVLMAASESLVLPIPDR